jgi:hypothetical protein
MVVNLTGNDRLSKIISLRIRRTHQMVEKVTGLHLALFKLTCNAGILNGRSRSSVEKAGLQWLLKRWLVVG